MKRVWLTSDPSDITQRDPGLVRLAAVALSRYAVDADGKGHRDGGDPVHEEVTEGRMLQWEHARAAGLAWALKVIYSSCGDLTAWVLKMLGCRDETIENRSDDGGVRPWAAGRNITMIAEDHPAIVRDGAPQPGDFVFVSTSSGGHIMVLEAWRPDGTSVVVVNQYGQPYGKHSVRQLTTQIVAGRAMFFVDGHPVEWWMDVTKVPLTESAIVPDDFPYGVLDDNPYPEPDVVV